MTHNVFSGTLNPTQSVYWCHVKYDHSTCLTMSSCTVSHARQADVIKGSSTDRPGCRHSPLCRRHSRTSVTAVTRCNLQQQRSSSYHLVHKTEHTRTIHAIFTINTASLEQALRPPGDIIHMTEDSSCQIQTQWLNTWTKPTSSVLS